MNRITRRTFCALLACSALPSRAAADAWPARPVRILVPGGVGGVTDIRARWLAAKLAPILGQQVIVENKPGAGGLIGMQAGARSTADGYTLVVVHQGTIAVNPHIYARLPYDPFADFAPLTRLGVGPLVLAAAPSLPVKSVRDLVALARERKAPVTFGSPGIGTPPHLAGELFKLEAGIMATHIPYRGGGAAASDLIAGHVDFSIEGFTVLLPHIQAGRLNALATTGAQRVAALPGVPTMQEAGLPGYTFQGWVGICAPAATAAPVLSKLYAAIAQVLGTQEARDWFVASGAETGLQPPEAFAAFMRDEHARWGRVIHAAGIRAE